MVDTYDTIVVGAGASGMMAAIVSARSGKRVLVLEKLKRIGAKLKASGGGRCNLSNTLSNDDFIASFGKDGRFMTEALNIFSHIYLIDFFRDIGLDTHTADGFHIFPSDHNSTSVISALQKEMDRLGISTICSSSVDRIITKDNIAIGVSTDTSNYKASQIIIATGGLGYPQLGSQGDGYEWARKLEHRVTTLYPAMMPLKVSQSWVANCRADTIGNAHIKVDIKKYKKLEAKGDLIFTKNGIRGPVVLDFSREITPLLAKMGEVPVLVNMTKGLNQEQIRQHLKEQNLKRREQSGLELVQTILPKSIAQEICIMADIDMNITLTKQSGKAKEKLIQLLAWTPLTIIGHDGFDMAMVTRGGVHLGDINAKTMQSKIVSGLYFCGEVVNIDGPCGGYNLQWAFSSGNLAGLGLD